MKRCPYCSKLVDPATGTKVVSDLGDGTGRRGRPGYRDQREVEVSPFECDHCGDGDALRHGEECAYCAEFDPPKISCCKSAMATGGAYHAPDCPEQRSDGQAD